MLPIKALHTCNLRLIYGKKQAKIYPNFLFTEFRSRSITNCTASLQIIRTPPPYKSVSNIKVAHGFIHLNSGVVVLNKIKTFDFLYNACAFQLHVHACINCSLTLHGAAHSIGGSRRGEGVAGVGPPFLWDMIFF